MPAAVTGRMNSTRDFYQGHRSRAMLRVPFNSQTCFHIALLLSIPCPVVQLLLPHIRRNSGEQKQVLQTDQIIFSVLNKM